MSEPLECRVSTCTERVERLGLCPDHLHTERIDFDHGQGSLAFEEPR